MLQGEHSAILSTFIKLPFVIKIFVLSILSGRFTQVLLYMNAVLLINTGEKITLALNQLKSKLVPGNTTITHCRSTRGTFRKIHMTLTVIRHQEDNLNKTTSYLFTIKTIAKMHVKNISTA